MKFNADAFRLVITHSTAAFVVIFGLLGLFALMWNDKVDVNTGLNALLIILGGAVTFLFVQEVAKQSEKAQARATENANAAAAQVVAAAKNGTTTTTTSTTETPST